VTSGDDTSGLLALAAEVAREAGALLRDGRESLAGAPDTKTSPTDVVTAMDRAAEDLIVSRLMAARPDDGVLAEEGSERDGTSGVRWVVDPLDGTVNYLYRLPSWSVSIAAEVGGEVVAGVVYDVPRDVLWSARRGAGAFRDGREVRCSDAISLDAALVATGFSYSAEQRAKQGRVLAAVLPAVRDIRRLGSAALDLCAVAAGHVDGYFEQNLHPWDLAAGGLIAREGGCRVEGLHETPAGYQLVMAAPPPLFGLLHDLLVALRIDDV
jgi:myo-inositol-1(or 4)-monophosphatase